jgi:hypothetical protein
LRNSLISWEKGATEEYEEYESAEGDRRWRFDDDADEAVDGDWRWRFDNAAEMARLLFMVDGVVLICELQGCGESKV